MTVVRIHLIPFSFRLLNLSLVFWFATIPVTQTLSIKVKGLDRHVEMLADVTVTLREFIATVIISFYGP